MCKFIGSSFYFAVCLIGEHEEGVYCRPVYVPLAAAITLPLSPPPTPNPDNQTLNHSESDLSFGTANPAALYKTGSKGSLLSLNQRVSNMHFGVPAHHEPPVDDKLSSPRGSLSIRRSMDYGNRNLGGSTSNNNEDGSSNAAGSSAVRDNAAARKPPAARRHPPAAKGIRSKTNLHRGK